MSKTAFFNGEDKNYLKLKYSAERLVFIYNQFIKDKRQLEFSEVML